MILLLLVMAVGAAGVLYLCARPVEAFLQRRAARRLASASDNVTPIRRSAEG